MTKEKWIKSPWTIGLGTTMFGFLLTMINDYSKREPILTTIWLTLKWIGNFIWAILNFDLKVWWLILVVLCLLLMLYFIAKFKREEIFKPEFDSYREDKFKDWKWTWKWELNRSKTAWIISELTAHCPNCDTSMIDRSSSYIKLFECPRCDFKATDRYCEEPFKIERLILDNVDRKEKK